MRVWPQITYLLLMALSLGVSVTNYGRPKTGTHTLIDTFIAMAIVLPLLYFGGFFDPLLR